MNLNVFSIRILYGRTDILLCTDCLYRLFAVQRVWLEKAYRNCLYPALWETLREEEKKEAAGTESAVSDAEVMGSTRYVYLDENAGKTAAPFMSQPLERNFIGEEEDVQQEDVECNLQLEKMKLLQEVQEDLDAESPEVESVSPVLSSRDMEVLGEYLTHQDEADHEKAMQAARVLFSIRQTSLIDVFLSNMENSAIVEELIDRYLDEDGNPRPLKVKDGNEPSDEWRKYI